MKKITALLFCLFATGTLLTFAQSAYNESSLEDISLGARVRIDHYVGNKVENFGNSSDYQLPSINHLALGLQFELEFTSLSTRFGVDFGLPGQIDHTYSIYKNDHTEGYKKRGVIRFNYIDFLIGSKSLIENVDGLYLLLGGGVRVASRMYKVDYDRDLYYVDIDNFDEYEANKRYTKAQFMIRGGAGYEYRMEKMAFFAEGIVSASIHDLVPEVKFPYVWSVGLTLGTMFYLN